MQAQKINFAMLLAAVLAGAMMFAAGWFRLHIDTDIVSSLPKNDPLISDALYIFKNHPMQDQVTVDVGIAERDLDLLIDCGRELARMLAASGLFETVGFAQMQNSLPLVANRVVDDLPFLFGKDDLEREVAPLLTPEKIAQSLAAHQTRLLSMEGIGQSAFLSKDPLGLKDLLLARMIRMAPTDDVDFQKGQLISKDGRHLLVIASPKASGTDTAFARDLSRFLDETEATLKKKYAAKGAQVVLTPVGAFRAALDNEEMVRRDVENAVLFATIGIILLLLLAFPRPLLGLLSLFPALMGAAAAFFVFSLINESISIMVLGFGGAIISISVDHGIAYLLFLDQPKITLGRQASHEVRSIGLLAVLTTVGAFGALIFSSFPVFQQLGLFTALGIGFSFITVHLIFPKIFISVGPASRRCLPLPAMTRRIFSFGIPGALLALALFLICAFWARPNFNVNLSAMNSVTAETRAAETKMAAVWGDIFSKVFLMTEAPDIVALQGRGDRLLNLLEADTHADLTRTTFLPAMLFPGKERGQANLEAWKAFWNSERTAAVTESLLTGGTASGFAPDAFEPFIAKIKDTGRLQPTTSMPPELFSFFGIVPGDSHTPWRQVVSLELPKSYPSAQFYQHYQAAAHIFDPGLFSERMGSVLFDTFLQLMISITVALAILLLIVFLDLRLTFITLMPLVFAMVCTLGCLNIMGRGLDIPGVMLAIVILGMGIDYTLYLVRAYQRYESDETSDFDLIRLTIFMASASTLIGFGVLIFSRHALLKSAGITSFMGIGFSFLGAALILPPLLKKYFRAPSPAAVKDLDIRARVRARYSTMETYVRMFVRFKLLFDPMFEELDRLLVFEKDPEFILDIGCGYGVPANWMAEKYPQCRIIAMDPDPARVYAARKTLGQRGELFVGTAPKLPHVPVGPDAVLMLDMLHHLNDKDLTLTLREVKAILAPGGQLILRAGMVPTRKRPYAFWLENLRIRAAGRRPYYRDRNRISALLEHCNFKVRTISSSGSAGELVWFCAAK